MALKRFNYKISRQISCPYGGCLLISQWNWVKQLSFYTVYLFSKETWRGIHVMHRFKLRYILCPYSWKRVVRQTNAWKDKNKGGGGVMLGEDDNLSITEQHFHQRILEADVNQVASRMKENWFTPFFSPWKKIWSKEGKKISGFHRIPEGLE